MHLHPHEKGRNGGKGSCLHRCLLARVVGLLAGWLVGWLGKEGVDDADNEEEEEDRHKNSQQ